MKKRGLFQWLNFSRELRPPKKAKEKKLESTNAQIRPGSTVNRLVASLCLSRGTWGLNTAHFICWTTWELGAQGITMRMLSVSRELTKPIPLPPPGPLHWWTLTRKLKECLPLSDPKGSPTTTTTPPPPPPCPPFLPFHHPVAAAAISSPSSSHPRSLHLSLTFPLWISVRTPPSSPSLGSKRTLLLTATVNHSTHWQTTESPTVCLHPACVKSYGLPQKR